MSKYIRLFSQITASDINLVGGKGANLGVLRAANINVPNGFCITTHAYKAFVAPEETSIYSAAKHINMDDLASLAKQANIIRKTLRKNPLPPKIIKHTLAAWQEMGAEHAYAVRSSATAEDLPQASFAGQQDTYLNIIGEQALLDAVKECFISLFTDRAILYRMQNGFEHADVALSVVVQKMILPESAGIMFTADPISGNRNITSIDASFGLGEALVSGLVSADLYKVDKLTGKILTKEIAEKKIAIKPLKQGGVETINLNENDRHTQTLSDDLIIKLSELGTHIEAHYGKPQDIEWAMADGELYITQSRPITSLFPIPNNGQAWPTDQQHVFLSFGHLQVMTDAMPPLSISFFKTLIPIGIDKDHIECPHMHNAGGRIYFNISGPLKHPIAKKIFPKLMSRADHLVSAALMQWQVKNPKFNNPSHVSTKAVLKFAIPFIGSVLNRLFWQKYTNMPQEMSQFSDDYMQQLEIKLAATSNQFDKMSHIVKTANGMLDTGIIWKPELLASMASIFLTGKLTKKWANKPDLDALTRGLNGNVTTEMDLAVGDLADAAQASQALKTHILSDVNVIDKIAQCTDIDGGADFVTAWNEFLRLYGSRANSEIDIYRPRWQEDPSSLMLMVMGILSSAKKTAHRVHYQQLITEHQQAVKNITKAANHGLMGWLRKPIVKRLLYTLDHLVPLREHHKFLMIRFMAVAKQHIIETAQYLVANKKLTHIDDIWFISMPEMLDLLTDKISISQAKIQARKTDFDHHQKLTPPRLITSTGEILKANIDNSHAPQGALIGSPVSAGIIEGIAKVITDPSTEVLHKGEILIAPFTDPGWTPLFVNAAGLVTEVGGLMTHGSVIAREYGLPAVVGVPDATKIIKTGDRVRVHGDAGYVEILEQKDSGETS
ncbi:MAG: phosphoenolpyruvate synthase [Alphaproteobacteria bacterium]|nr:phosphoenolpyruvate synthase [Alphaproteobacteria bacterium]